MANRRFAFRRRANEVFPIVDDLLEINAKPMPCELQLLRRRIDKERANVVIGSCRLKFLR